MLPLPSPLLSPLPSPFPFLLARPAQFRDDVEADAEELESVIAQYWEETREAEARDSREAWQWEGDGDGAAGANLKEAKAGAGLAEPWEEAALLASLSRLRKESLAEAEALLGGGAGSDAGKLAAGSVVRSYAVGLGPSGGLRLYSRSHFGLVADEEVEEGKAEGERHDRAAFMQAAAAAAARSGLHSAMYSPLTLSRS